LLLFGRGYRYSKKGKYLKVKNLKLPEKYTQMLSKKKTTGGSRFAGQNDNKKTFFLHVKKDSFPSFTLAFMIRLVTRGHVFLGIKLLFCPFDDVVRFFFIERKRFF